MNRHIYRLFFWIVVFVLAVSTQVKSQNILNFQSLNEKFGISLRETTSACMDSNGFVWIASKMGILRVVEDDYRIYQLPYESPDVVFVKLHYANDTLYVYSNNGQIFVYNAVQDRFDLLQRLINLVFVLHCDFVDGLKNSASLA